MIYVKDNVEVLSQMDLTKDIIISFKNYKDLETLKMTEVYDANFDIIIKTIKSIKAININNSLQFDYSPNLKISTPINFKLQLCSNIENTRLEYTSNKQSLNIDGTDNFIIIYKNFQISLKQIDIRKHLNFTGNVIPIGIDILSLDFLYRCVDSPHNMMVNNIYCIQNSMIYDNFPNFSEI